MTKQHANYMHLSIVYIEHREERREDSSQHIPLSHASLITRVLFNMPFRDTACFEFINLLLLLF